jgi:hypothetical protein
MIFVLHEKRIISAVVIATSGTFEEFVENSGFSTLAYEANKLSPSPL